MAGALMAHGLLLRRPVAGDLDDIAALHGDQRVMRMIDNGCPVPRAVVQARDMPWLTADYGPGLGYWIGLRSDRDFVGWFGLRPLPGDPGVVELGYRLTPAMWGRGLASAGARRLVEHAFTDVGARRVYATTMTVNLASRRVLERAGLQWERTFFEDCPVPLPGSEHGDVEYGISAEAWQNSGTARRPSR